MTCFMHALLEGLSASCYQAHTHTHAVEPFFRMFTCVCGIEAYPTLRDFGAPDNKKEGLQSYQTDLGEMMHRRHSG